MWSKERRLLSATMFTLCIVELFTVLNESWYGYHISISIEIVDTVSHLKISLAMYGIKTRLKLFRIFMANLITTTLMC